MQARAGFAAGGLARSALPIEIEFGIRPPHFLLPMLALIGFAAFGLDWSSTIEVVPLALFTLVWVGMGFMWLIPTLRGTARGRLRIGTSALEILGRIQTSVALVDCRDFTLSKTGNRISCRVTGQGVRHFDHLRLSREGLAQLARLLNELATAARGETLRPESPLSSPRDDLRAPVPPHLKGSRIGPADIWGHAARTAYITLGTLLLCGVVFLPLSMSAAQCPQPASDSCRAIAPVMAIGLLLAIPVIPAAVYLWRRYRTTAGRLRDLDELPTRSAVLRAMIPFTALRNRIVGEYGTPGPNRFGPPSE